MPYNLTSEDIKLIAPWKRDEKQKLSQIARRFNTKKGLTGDNKVTYKDVKKALKGIPSKHHQEELQTTKKRKEDFDRFFDDL